jgi:signal transduction histidine kinase
MARGYPSGPPLGPTVALYLLAASRDAARPWTRRITIFVIAAFCLHVTAFGIGHGQVPEIQLAVGALVWALAWFAGERTRLRRQQLDEFEHRAIRAEHEAMQERRLAVAEERARIARDLHDSAAHAINVIAIQAGAARLWQEQDPARSRTAQIELSYGERTLELTVSNAVRPDAPTRVSSGGGHGLVGMCERAALLGGELEAGRRNRSFRVHARLPYGDAP